MENRALVIIPTYNEKENIEMIVPEVLAQNPLIDVLVVDDNSPDGTYKSVEKLMAEYGGRVSLIRRAGKLGLGTAYIEGFKFAITKGYCYIFEMDADFSHKPSYLNTFLKEIKENDLVIGSRYIGGGGVENWGAIRKFISRGGSLYSKIILGAGVNDFTGGFKCFRREALEKIGLDKIVSNGYSFQVELNYRTWLAGLKIKETPIIFEDRRVGQSKMSKKIFMEAIGMVWRLRLNMRKIKRGEW